ncbi:MAG: hypothetical protein K6G31_03495 [Paludibacteraceae bacterium]|nr:hypothetical protein [Paludibacteraceae bacterium]MCR5568320.1 hypothetical protein [Paludibacteraceae bacterium]
MNRFLTGILFFVLAAPSFAASVILEGCDKLTFTKGRVDCQVLKGNVRFRQDRAVMFCDSAYFYSGQNSFDAFGHVRVVQDSTTLTANKMFYDGNIKLMRIREDITMTSGRMTLTTQKLDFFREKNYAYYDNGATIVDPSFRLVSRIGYYYPDSKKAIFKGNVDLNGTDYRITTDTLTYNSRTSEAWVMGPSKIYRDSFIISSSQAYMNNAIGEFKLYRRSMVDNEKSTRHVEADTILYNRTKGSAKLYGKIVIDDLNQHMSMYGDKGELNQQPLSNGFLTKNAYIKEYSTPDTLFLRADTLTMITNADSSRIVEGRNRVRFYRSDFQGKSQQMQFFSKDSIVYMYGLPVLWSDANQMTGDTVKMYMKNKKPDFLHIVGNSLVVQRDDSINYNQIKGNELEGYFVNSNLHKVLVKGNAMSVYFPKDKKGDLIGVNHNMGSMMTIFLNEQRKLDKIVLEPGTEGTMYPPFEAPNEVLFLKGFSWMQKERPKKASEIFTLFD